MRTGRGRRTWGAVAALALAAPAGWAVADRAAAVSPCALPASVTAPQVVVVRSSGTRATITGCTRNTTGRYRTALGSFAGRVGVHGVAAPGAKREGDGRTPGGQFALRTAFGTAAEPGGLALRWFGVDANDVWVDDSASPLYNTLQQLPAAGRWSSAEKLDVPPYVYAQVIGYNEARTPGRGSAIFLHVNTGRGATAGCVSLTRTNLLALLRWQRPGAVIRIS